MRIRRFRDAIQARRGAIWALGFLFALNSCGMDKVTVPDFSGPSGQGELLSLTATPDVLVANGVSTSQIVATFNGPNGQPIAGRDIFVAVADSGGRFADIGDLTDPLGADRSAGTGIIVRTRADGKAVAIYRSPPRTDATANQAVVISARPVGTDFNGALYKYVRIELRSAEPRLFPQIVGNTAPTCNFVVETPSGTTAPVIILFQSTSSDSDGTIVRYYWDFGNGQQSDHPDNAVFYGASGGYTVTHIVTDNGGLQSACAARLTLQ